MESYDQFAQIDTFVEKYGFTDVPYTPEVHQYRMDLLSEEYEETVGAHMTGDAECLVDGHVDMIVILMGNLAMMGVDGKRAFNEVMRANMSKVLAARKDGDPDGASIAKPVGWVGPDHSDNHGKLDEIYDK